MKNKTKVVKINFDFENMKWQNLTASQIKVWKSLYPGVDVEKILLHDMPQAIDKKVDRIDGEIIKRGWVKDKKAHHWKQTICNWFKREQMKIKGVI